MTHYFKSSKYQSKTASLFSIVVSVTTKYMCISLSAFWLSSFFKIEISCLSLADAKCLPGVSPSSKYLPPVGENSS